MACSRSVLVPVLSCLVGVGCAVSQGYRTAYSQILSGKTAAGKTRTVPTGPTFADLRQIRDKVLILAEALRGRAEEEAKRFRKGFLGWSVAGLAVGGGGSIASALVNPESTKAKTAQVTAALGTGITGILAAYSFDAKAKQFETCAASIRQYAAKFYIDWSDQTGLKGKDTDEVPEATRKTFITDSEGIANLEICSPGR